MSNLIDLSGQKFGRLKVIERDTDHISPSGRKYVRWKCICDCGQITSVYTDALKRGQTQSCGCLGKERRGKSSITHGETNTRLYSIWTAMKRRCFNSNCSEYKDYGGRGITICDEWANDYTSFRDWALESGYQDNLSIDRNNNNGNYEPNNCSWVTSVAQANNRRSNHEITFENETHNVTEWAIIKGINPKTLFNRLYTGWSVEDALST